nr:hypothetical protein [Gemmatimonadota bacterium]
AGIRSEAEAAGSRLPAPTAARLLGRAWDGLEGGKRIFDVRVSERVRVLNGEGAIVYAREPLRLRLDVFGPHSTPLLSLVQRGDSLAVRLHEQRRFVEGTSADPRFAELTEGRAFTGPELVGALLGAYDADRLLQGAADTLAWSAGGEWVVALLERNRAHRFTYAQADSSLRTYRQERGGRLAYRVRFSDYRAVAGRARPFRVELEDVGGRRTVRVDVRRETLDPDVDVEDDAFRLAPF